MNRQTTSHPVEDPLIAVAAYAPKERGPDTFDALHDRVLRDGARATTEPVRRATTRSAGAARRRVVLVGAAAAGALALTVGLGTSWLSPNDAYASWTPTPTTPSAAALARAAATCEPGAAPTTTILAEQRGVFTFTLRSDGRRVLDCLLDENGSGGAGGVNLADLRPPAGDGVTVVTDMSTWNVDNGDAAALYGRAGEGVTGVTITQPNGFAVEATVSGGWWAAWWPGGGSDPEATLTVHRSDGTTAAPIPIHDPTVADFQ